MTKLELLNDLKRFEPFNEQESKDKQILIDLLEDDKDYFNRNNLIGHFSASSWILSLDHKKVLMCYHNIYNSWSWLGGHADGNYNLKEVAIKEAKEESGIKNIKLLSDDIFSVEILTVDGHIKNNEYINSHLHYNITYLLEADDKEKLKVKEDENSNLSWFDLDEAVNKSNEKWIRDNIYSKLNKKLVNLK